VKPELLRFGKSQTPVVVIDDFSNSLEHILEIADELAPYPRHTNYYPGLRRIFTAADTAANAYVRESCERAAQFIADAFDIDVFDLVEAGFSMVTLKPTELTPPQRAPHFDTTNEKDLALLHFLRVPPNSGTAFYRQRATGIERVTEFNVSSYVPVAEVQIPQLPSDSGYFHGSDEFFEQIGTVEAVPDRMIIFQGSLLHSGIIPPDTPLTGDPRQGRLTANIFVRGH
jgi:Family of unknown function (DUF6445)